MEGGVQYDLSIEDFVDQMEGLAKSGAHILGGCCGTTPAYIEGLKERLKYSKPPGLKETRLAAVCSSTKLVSFDKAPVIIGERINPAGKAVLKKSFQEGRN